MTISNTFTDRSTGHLGYVDPLVPDAALLPLCDTPGGAMVPPIHLPGEVRPWCALLAVAPVEAGKHETTSTRWTENKETQRSDDGRVVPDTVPIQHTDT